VAEDYQNKTGLLSTCDCAKNKDNKKDRQEIITCQKTCEKWPLEAHKQFKDGFCWHYRTPTKHCDYR